MAIFYSLNKHINWFWNKTKQKIFYRFSGSSKCSIRSLIFLRSISSFDSSFVLIRFKFFNLVKHCYAKNKSLRMIVKIFFCELVRNLKDGCVSFFQGYSLHPKVQIFLNLILLKVYLVVKYIPLFSIVTAKLFNIRCKTSRSFKS